MRTITTLFATLTLVAALVSACGSSGLNPAGYGCTSSDQCAAGLSCLGVIPVATDAGMTCATAAMTCSKQCSTDADCAAVGANFKCFPGCSGMMACALTM